MSKHIETRKKIKNINRKVDFYSLIDECMLSDKEKQLMCMHYVEDKDFGFIADTLGYTQAGVIRMHKRILHKLESLL